MPIMTANTDHLIKHDGTKLTCTCGNDCIIMGALPPLSSSDPLNLGYKVGASHRVWTGDTDTVLGYDEYGWVWVQDFATGAIRRHLTASTTGKHPQVHVCFDCGNSGTTSDFMTTHTCLEG